MNWNEMKETMEPFEMCRTIMRDYIKHQSFKELSKIYGRSEKQINNYILNHKRALKSAFPNLWTDYKNATLKNRGYDEEKDPRIKLNKASFDEHLKNMPKVIKYDDFLNCILTFNTGSLTGNDLVKIAQSKGIKVIG